MPETGYRKWLGLEYEVMEDGHAIVHMPIRPEMRNLRDVVQGGAVASLIDVAMATAASGGNQDTRTKPMATLELKVNYLAAATGARLTAKADVIRSGNRTSVLRCDIYDDKGNVCATGLGTFIARRVSSKDPKQLRESAGSEG